MDLKNLSDEELFDLYPELLKELKGRKLITTNNLVGEMGERVAINQYIKTEGIVNLKKAPPSTPHYDAKDDDGNKYAIKSTSGSSTGKFDSIPKKITHKAFDFLIVVLWDKNYKPKNIYQLTWEQFLKYKRWKKPENMWYVPVPIKIRDKFIKIL